MTPRTEVEAVPASGTLPELFERAAISTHSRWLVFDGSLDNIVGLPPVRILFRHLGARPELFRLQTLLRLVLVAPASKPADDLLDELRSSRQQLAVLLDEYGGTAGHHHPAGPPRGPCRPDRGGVIRGACLVPRPVPAALNRTGPVLDGLMRLSEFEEVARLRLAADAYQFDTLGGLVMHRLGRVPSLGDEIRLNGWLVRVEELDGRRAARVRVVPSSPTTAPDRA